MAKFFQFKQDKNSKRCFQSSTFIFDMEQSNSLLLNEESYKQCPDPSKPIFVYEWLRYLEKVLPLTKKDDLKNCQQKLVEQIIYRISTGPAPPIRNLLAKCVVEFFNVADTYTILLVVNACNDAIKSKEQDLSQLHVKLTALAVIGKIYNELGRLVGRTYEDTAQSLFRWIKTSESNTRAEILFTFSKMIRGLGSAAHILHRDLYKILSKTYLNDRVLRVRIAAINCIGSILADKNSPIYLNIGIESITIVLVKSLIGSNYEVRQALACVFARVASRLIPQTSSAVHRPSTSLQQNPQQTPTKDPQTINDLLQSMDDKFLRGGIGGFLKTAAKKPSPEAQKQIRIGLTLAFIQISTEAGPKWLEKNLQLWIKNLLILSEKLGPIAETSEQTQAHEAIFMRRCIDYILQNTIVSQFSEPTQLVSCRCLGVLLSEYINKFDCVMDDDGDRELNADVHSSAQAATVCLTAIGRLVVSIGTPAEPLFVEATGILEPVFACLIHPIYGTQIAAAWCLRCILLSVPILGSSLVDRCLNRLEYMKKSPEALNGCSFAISAILVELQGSITSVSYSKCQQVFSIAEQMLKTATQNTRLVQRKISSGWLLICSLTSLGKSFMKNNIGRTIALWRSFFPRSLEEARNEKCRGDVFTWEGTLEARSGALASMACFLRFCPDQVDQDLIKKVMSLIETVLATLSNTSDLLFTHGTQLRPAICLLRIRLYMLLNQLQTSDLEAIYTPILRELVADITLNDSIQASYTTSLIPDICSALRPSVLVCWQNDTHGSFEVESCFASTASRSLEHDHISLIFGNDFHDFSSSRIGRPGIKHPQEPLPINVASIDYAILFFGRVFPTVASKHKLQIINHFSECLAPKNAKPGPRFCALQMNVLGAICFAMKCIGENKTGRIEGDQLKQSCAEIALPFLSTDNIVLKCLAIETLCRISQAVAEPHFVAANAQYCFNNLRTLSDERSRTGYVLSLGCLHYYVGSLGVGQHLNTCVSMLLTLAQDNNSPFVQAWSTLSLSLVASSGGGMFRAYVEPCLSLCMRLLLNTQNLHVEIIRAVAKLMSALITAIGPELSLAGGTIENMRSSFLIVCSMLIDHPDVLTQSEGIYCIQQLHLFAPRFVQLDNLVSMVCSLINSPHLVLRKAGLSTLCQLLQREAKQVHELANNLIIPLALMPKPGKKRLVLLPDTGLEGALFDMLDLEFDDQITRNIKESQIFLVQSTSVDNLNFWLVLCRDVVASSMNAESINRNTLFVNDSIDSKASVGEDNDQTLSSNDDETLHSGILEGETGRAKIIPHRWQTRAFAFEIVQKIMTICETGKAHFDLALAKELQQSSADQSDYLVFHLSDLIRMGFMGATSENKTLRLAGLECLHEVITRFATAEEPEFPGHLLLEQFQAQVSAALRPAFNPETPPDVTATACQVCSTWICSGVAHDINDLRRIHQLLVTSLNKLKGQFNENHVLISDGISIIEKLSILSAWAEIYTSACDRKSNTEKSIRSATQGSFENLLDLVNPELPNLIGYWISVLRDIALLSLPTEFVEQTEYGSLILMHSKTEEYYRRCWPPILLAASIWLRENDFCVDEISMPLPLGPDSVYAVPPLMNGGKESILNLIIGICVESLSKHQSHHCDKTIQICVRAIQEILHCEWAMFELMNDVQLPIEFLNVLHKLLLIRDNLQTQTACAKLALTLVNTALFVLDNQSKNSAHSIQADSNLEQMKFVGGEGVGGSFSPKNTLTFALLEISLVILVRQMPEMNTSMLNVKPNVSINLRNTTRFSGENNQLIQVSIRILTFIQHLCCPEGYLIVLPSILYILFGIIRESSKRDTSAPTEELPNSSPAQVTTYAIIAIRNICPVPPDEQNLFEKWQSVIGSALLSILKMSEDGSVPKHISVLTSTILLTTATEKIADQSVVSSQINENRRNFLLESELFEKYCTLLKDCISSDQLDVQLTTLQSIYSVLQNPKLCGSFAQELGTSLFSKLKPYILGPSDDSSELDLPVIESLSQQELNVIKETIGCFESILTAVAGDKKRAFVSLLIRSLVRFLHPDPVKGLSTCLKTVYALHEYSLQRLNLMGLQHPEPFKALLKSNPRIQQRIESATQELFLRQKQNDDSELEQRKKSLESTGGNTIKGLRIEPMIKLSTDFCFKKDADAAHDDDD